MAEINDGALAFKSVMDNDQINTAIDETLRRVKGLSDGTVAGGKKMDAAFNVTADSIKSALSQIGAACEMHEKELQRLEAEYQELGQKASVAFSAGRDEEYRAITAQQNAVKGEITVREKLLQELREQSNELEKVSQKQKENSQKTLESSNAQVSMRTQIRNLKEEMMMLVNQGVDEQSEAYQRLRNELGRLTDIQNDVMQQGRTLANDEQMFQGVITGLSGLAGGFSAVTGTVSLFAGENEDLQKVMMKVQSVMAITIGMQQVAQTLNKDSAFRLVVINGLKEWWHKIVVKSTVAETAETVATTANTAAKNVNANATVKSTAAEAAHAAATGAQTTAATAGTAANIGLAGAFRLVGNAIKAIPGVGWILAGIGAIVGLVTILTKKSREAKKEQQEFNKALTEVAYKPIGALQELSAKWAALGNDMNAKKKFVEDNQKAFEGLGVAVEGVEDAENLLIKNKDAFIDAQIAKAKAAVYSQQALEKVKRQVQLEQEISQMQGAKIGVVGYVRAAITGTGVVENKPLADRMEELNKLKEELKTDYENIANWEKKGAEILKNAGIDSAAAYEKGTIGYIEQAISDKQEALKRLSDPKKIQENIKETEALQMQLDALTGKVQTSAAAGMGADYAEKNKQAVEAFNNQLNEELDNAESVLEMLNVISEKRKELKNDGTELDNSIKAKLDEAEKNIVKKAGDDYKKSLADYKAYQLEKLTEEERYLKQKAELEKQLEEATEPAQKQVIQTQLNTLNVTHELEQEQTYDEMVEKYKNYQERIKDISADYDSQIALATKKNNAALVAELQKAKEEALGKEAMNELVNSATYTELFSNLDNLTVARMIELRDKLEAEWENMELSPKELEALRNKIDEVNQEIQSRNPFASLADAIKRYKAAADDAAKKDALKDVFQSTAASIDMVRGALDSVIGGLVEMGLAGDEETQKVLSDISGMMAGASSVAMGIATGNPLQVIQGSIDLITKGIDLIAGAGDRKLNRQIKEHQKNVKELQNQYEQLERAIDKALGSERYTSTKNELNNLKAQQKELTAMAQAERDKKKTDKAKVEEYEQAIEDNAVKMMEIIESLREDIMGGTAASIANDLGNAFIDAFAAGEDAAAAFNDKVEDIVANIMRKMLIQKLLEQPIGAIIDKYAKMWIDDSGNFIGFDAVLGSAGAMGAELEGVGSAFAAAMESLPEDIKKYFTDGTGGKGGSSLSGAIKGVTEETASILSGQANAMRINQAEANEILRQQLALLSTIAYNTTYNHHLSKLSRIVSLLEGQGVNNLRPFGVI